jgi:mRNA-degrading endonuclease RelE of RelBE toxin-antitoxin system
VISKVRPSFRRDFERLAPSVKTRARLAYQLFAENPNHPSLRFKKLQGSDRVWSIRISEQYRAVGVRSGDTIEWSWIGTHNEFDNLFS